MKRFIILLLVLTACSQGKQPAWKLVWSDEFNYSGLPDSLNWGNEVGFVRNNELQYYTMRRPENSVVVNGNLLIISRKEPFDSANYTSASLTTDRKHSWTYGKIEARMKLPKGQGMWPAFWMLGQNIHEVGWPRCGEIDIMEHINAEDILYGTLHWYNEKHISSGSNIPCTVNQYHDYSVEWNKDSIIWLLDGKPYHNVSIRDSINSTAEFHMPQYIILNLAIGGDWPKNPDETTTFPDTMYVDYVRVYQR
ncbi:MAG: glycoside hydrolase family 16 protein [Bacteroidota bacterium]|nr:glycoside hydrolase family 16 protein [Bacteroidota bacterium]